MRSRLTTLVLLILSAAPARAFQSVFTVTGAGGACPPVGTGGGGIYPTVLPAQPFVSTVNVAFPVVHVSTVRLNGFAHSFAGDVQAVIEDPTGKRYNVFVRSGFNGAGSGNSSAFASGIFSFNNPLSPAGAPFPGSGTISQAIYHQDTGGSGSPPAPWPDGTNGIFNTGYSSIHGPAGTWKLVIYDWKSNNVGTLTSWELQGTWNNQPISVSCTGDGTLATACPCGNTGLPGRGCQNSAGTGGALLAATGSVNPDNIVLTVLGELPTALTIFLQGTFLLGNGAVFGDGVICAGGNLKRLYVKSAAGGFVSAPGPGDPSITARSAALGDVIPGAGTRYYHAYYRDSSATFCPAPTGSTFNASAGLKIIWI